MRLRPENVPHGYAILICQTCKAQIGLFKPEDLSVPMMAGMFKSIDEHHGFPPPFPVVPGRNSTMTWEFSRCPYCGRRPFLQRDAVMTSDGLFKVGDPLIPRKERQEDRNQRLIANEWARWEAEQKTLGELNQEIIKQAMVEEPTEEPEQVESEEIEKPKKKPGRPFGWRKQK